MTSELYENKSDVVKEFTREIQEIYKNESATVRHIEYLEYVNSPKKGFAINVRRFNRVIKYKLEEIGLTFSEAHGDPTDLGFMTITLNLTPTKSIYSNGDPLVKFCNAVATGAIQ